MFNQLMFVPYDTSILTIYPRISLSGFDVKMYLLKHLTQTIFSGILLSLSLTLTLKNHVHNLNIDNIFRLFSLPLCHKNLCTKNLTGAIGSSPALSPCLARYEVKIHESNLNTENIFGTFVLSLSCKSICT